jgi:hypothetical protein
VKNIPRYVLYPNAPFRQRWDIFIIVLVLYNVMLIPMELGLELETNTAWSVIDYMVDLTFAIDIMLNFRTGYFDERNILVMDTKAIALRYIRSWFFIDVLATFPFELLALIAGIEAGDNVRLFAVLKCPRLLRLGRILKFLENMRGANVWRIVRLFILFFMMSHWVGCLWYLIAASDSKEESVTESNNFTNRYVYAVFNGLLLLVGESIEAHED